MSSQEFLLAFRRASEIIEEKLGNEDVRRILKDIFERACASEDRAPKNRELFIDSRVDSQMIRVPEATYMAVIKELRNLNLVNVWARATCPNTEEIIVETPQRKKFRQRLTEPCIHCGKDHSDLDFEHIELVFVINRNCEKGTEGKSLLRLPLLTDIAPSSKSKSIGSSITRWFKSFFFQKRLLLQSSQRQYSLKMARR